MVFDFFDVAMKILVRYKIYAKVVKALKVFYLCPGYLRCFLYRLGFLKKITVLSFRYSKLVFFVSLAFVLSNIL